MNVIIALLVGFIVTASASTSWATDWSQPDVGCVEEVIYRPSPYGCPDFSRVDDHNREFPASMPQQERDEWTRNRRQALRICRAEETLRREAVRPGSQGQVAVQVSWMLHLGTQHSDEKIEAIYRASEVERIPPQTLLGALTQESLLAELGISDDGGNFSCGIGQMNLLEWCRWAEKQPLTTQLAMGWPVDQILKFKKAQGVSQICTTQYFPTSLVKPFHEIGLKRLKGLPEYRLRPEHLDRIALSDVVQGFPAGSPDLQKLRYAIVQSFTQSCSDYRFGIPAKAYELRKIFETMVPRGLQQVQAYTRSRQFQRQCRAGAPVNAYYPLHTGWLLADAVYNAGPGAISAVQWYLGLDAKASADPKTWEKFSPTDLIEALYWAGIYNPQTDLLEHWDLEGRKRTMGWYKACVVQRHVARVVQHVTLPGHDLAQSLEGSVGCQKTIPEARKTSTGKKLRH